LTPGFQESFKWSNSAFLSMQNSMNSTSKPATTLKQSQAFIEKRKKEKTKIQYLISVAWYVWMNCWRITTESVCYVSMLPEEFPLNKKASEIFNALRMILQMQECIQIFFQWSVYNPEFCWRISKQETTSSFLHQFFDLFWENTIILTFLWKTSLSISGSNDLSNFCILKNFQTIFTIEIYIQKYNCDPKKQILIPESKHWCQRPDFWSQGHNSGARQPILIPTDITLMPESRY